MLCWMQRRSVSLDSELWLPSSSFEASMLGRKEFAQYVMFASKRKTGPGERIRGRKLVVLPKKEN
jgi:hypothetical protein